MTACREFEPLLLDRAAGDLSPDRAEALDLHLAGCEACRAEAEAYGQVLSLASLPAPSAAERAALGGLADSVRLARAQGARRLGWPARFAAGLAAAAAAAAFLAVPAFSRKGPTLTSEEVAQARAAAAPAARWTAPDPDELWETAGTLLGEAAPATGAAEPATPIDTSKAVAAADAWFPTDPTTQKETP
jgi:anti-sigma factor RsiW